jgi:predicted nucleic acid-binding protein
MSYARKKIVVDTSSLIAACIYPEREPALIIKQAISRFQLVASPQTKWEIEDVLKRAKFDKWQPFEARMVWLNDYIDTLADTIFHKLSRSERQQVFRYCRCCRGFNHCL